MLLFILAERSPVLLLMLPVHSYGNRPKEEM